MVGKANSNGDMSQFVIIHNAMSASEPFSDRLSLWLWTGYLVIRETISFLQINVMSH